MCNFDGRMESDGLSQHVNNMLSAAAPFLRLCKVLGLSPMAADHEGRLRRTAKDTAYSCVLVLLQLLSLLFCIYYTLEVTRCSSLVHFYLVLVSNSLLSALTLLVIVHRLATNCDIYDQILRSLALCDSVLFPDAGPLYRRMRRFLITEMTLSFPFLTIAYSYWIFSVYQNILLTIFSILQFFQVITLFVAELKFMNLVMGVRDRLVRLNELLVTKNFTDNSCLFHTIPLVLGTEPMQNANKKCKLMNIFEPRTNKVSIRSLRKTYNTLCDVTDLIMLSNRFMIMVLLLLLMMVVISVINTLSGVEIQESERMGHDSATGAICILIDLVSLVILNVPAQLVVMEAAKVPKTIATLLLSEDLCPENRLELQEFLQQLTARKIEFSVYGIFNMDMKMCASFVATLTTYTVVVLTFK